MPPPPWNGYTAGGVDKHGKQIRDLIHLDFWSCVYTTEDDRIGWQHRGSRCIDAPVSAAESSALLNELRAVVKDAGVRRDGIRLIATCLSRAFIQRITNDDRNFFTAARDFLDTKRREALHITYLASAFAASAIIASAGLALSPYVAQSDYFVAAALGAVGGFVSVAQRFRSLPIDAFSSVRYTAVSGTIRAILGGVFGALFLLFQRAGLLLSVINGRPAAIYSLALIAGFSERFIPELLHRLESTDDPRTA
jgi:hypothetical protein